MDESDYEKATDAGVVFLPLAGSCRSITLFDFGEIGYYWSNTNAGWDIVYSVNITSVGTCVIQQPVKAHFCSVRLVEDYNSVN